VKSSVSKEFRELFQGLPNAVQQQATRAYALWRSDPLHPSLHFRRVSQNQPLYSARIGMSHRALGLRVNNHLFWFWIGSHADYDEILRRR
jgi:hypothetical protein